MSDFRAFLGGLTGLSIGIAGSVYGLALSAEHARLPLQAGYGPEPRLPPPSVQLAAIMNDTAARGWRTGQAPTAGVGLSVSSFASGLTKPTWLYCLPNGDVLVAETEAPSVANDTLWDLIKWLGWGASNPDRIVLLRDADRDGHAETKTVLLDNLRSPFGMTLVDGHLYVANFDAIVRYPYSPGQTRIAAAAEHVVDLPAAGGRHWAKNLIVSPAGDRIYYTVGSHSNVGELGPETEEGRAAIWELDVSNGQVRQFAFGMRSPNGMDWNPLTGELWVVVNERTGLGSDLVPDYVTSVREGNFYGWPYTYYGQHADPRMSRSDPSLGSSAIKPDYAVGPHTRSLGLAFSYGSALPEAYRNGVIVTQYGSWNRRPKSGYKVIYIPFRDGRPDGSPVDVLTGFLDENEQARGRPVGVVFDATGGLLVADKPGGVVWRVSGSDAVSER